MPDKQNDAMTADDAIADIAFLKNIITDHTPALRTTGLLYGAAGLLYGAQCLINWLVIQYWPTAPSAVHLGVGLLPTAIFVVMCVVVSMRSKMKGFGTGTAQRAIGASFAGAGIANICLVIVFGYAAYIRKDFSVWLFYPVTVCALQGAVWYAAAVVRRRWWMGSVALGWFVTAILTGLVVRDGQAFILVLGLALLLCMALPGYILIRISKVD